MGTDFNNDSLILDKITNLKSVQLGVGSWDSLTEETQDAIHKLISLPTIYHLEIDGMGVWDIGDLPIHGIPSGLRSLRLNDVRFCSDGGFDFNRYSEQYFDEDADTRDVGHGQALAQLETLNIGLNHMRSFCEWLTSTYSTIHVGMLRNLYVATHPSQLPMLSMIPFYAKLVSPWSP
jgi:hypothetical protein